MSALATLRLEAAARPIKTDCWGLYDVWPLPEPGLGVFAHAGSGVESHSGTGHVDGIGRRQHSAAWLGIQLGISGLDVILGKGIAGFPVQLDAIRGESDSLRSINYTRRTRKR